MLPGPILRREMKAATSGRGWFVTRALMVLMIGICVVAPAMSLEWIGDRPGEPRTYGPDQLRNYSAYTFAVVIGIEIMFLAPLAAASAGVSIAEEREKDTLSQLLLTRLTRLELAATKLAGRLLPTLLLMIAGLPFLLLGAWWAGLSPLLTIEILGLLAGTLAVAAGFGILASARRDRQVTARLEAIGWTMVWLIGLPLLSRLPAASGTLWGELLIEVRRVCSWLAPSSPFSLLTEPTWFIGGPRVGAALSERLLLMAGLQAVVVGLTLAGAVAGLRLREPHARELDPFGGYRPPVGDDPIYWREYLLPWRGARGLAIWIYLRHLYILLRGILFMAFQALGFLLLTVVILGMVIGAGWYGYRAFEEAWRGRVFPGGPYEARDAFNGFIRWVTFFLGVSPAAATAATLASQFVIERDKKTWDSLLATPLTGTEILGSKLRVVVRNLWQAWRWMIPLGLLGVVCDALHPLGLLIAAAGLCAVAGLGLGIGAAAALKQDATSQAVNNQAALWMVALLALGGLTILAPLCSAHQFHVFWTQAPWRPTSTIVVIATALIAIVASLAIGYRLIRRSFERFDEWVGRPHRKEDAPIAAPVPEPVASPQLDTDAA